MSDSEFPCSEESLRVPLRSGDLALTVEHAELPVGELCGYACRRSRKRGFVFVSKVLGKHYPVRPRRMEEIHARLAAKLVSIASPAVVIGMAETATGLAQGVFEHLQRRTGRVDLLYIHTTRYRLNRPLALRFEESHSHASEHLLHEPVDDDAAMLFREAASVVLIDDELSTGRTLANLATAYRDRNPGLREVHIACITEWLGADRRAEVAGRIGRATHFHSLLRGRFAFDERSDFDPGAIPEVVGRGDFKDKYLPRNFGRLGVRGPLDLDLRALAERVRSQAGERLLVLGTGEFAHPPFLLARHLEARGADVHFQSTTRSPLLPGDALASAIETVDNYHDDIPNYVYNVADRRYDRIVLCHEARPLPAAHRLHETLGADTLFF